MRVVYVWPSACGLSVGLSACVHVSVMCVCVPHQCDVESSMLNILVLRVLFCLFLFVAAMSARKRKYSWEQGSAFRGVVSALCGVRAHACV